MGSQPKAPDPYDQMKAQQGSNAWTAQFNAAMMNPNQYTPYGNVINAPGAKIPIYDQKGKVTGYANQWNQTTTLSPAQQAIFDQENAAKLGLGKFANQQIGTATKVLGKAFNTQGLPEWQTYGEGPDLRYDKSPTDRQAIEDAIMASTRRGLTPQWDAENAQLAARGMGAPGSEMGYATDQARGDVLAEAGRGAYLASGEESRSATEAVNKVLQQMFLNENLGVDQANAVRQGMFGERQQERNQIVNEIAALLGGGQATVPQGQAFQGTATNPFDIAGAQNQKYAIDSQNYTNKMTGLFGLGGNLLKAFNPFSMFG